MSALLANDYVAKISVSKSSKSGSSSSSSSSTSTSTHRTHIGTSTSHYPTNSHHHSGAGSVLGGILVLALIAAVAVAAVFMVRRLRHRPASSGQPNFAPTGDPLGQPSGYGKNL